MALDLYPDLNPIKTLGYTKRKLNPEDNPVVKNLKKALRNIWVQKINTNYIKDHSASMVKHLQEVTTKRGDVLK